MLGTRARLAAFFLLVPVLLSRAHELHVSPAGDDRNAGSEARPFRTLEHAIRASAGKPGTTVIVAAGVYELRRTLEITARQSGITLRSAPGAEVRLSGGRALPVGRFIVPSAAQRQRLDPEARPHVLVIDLAALGLVDLGDVASNRAELFFNRRPLQLARWPNEGFATDLQVAGGEPFVSAGVHGDRSGILFYDGERPQRWLQEKDLWVHGYWFWDWADGYQRVQSIDPTQKLLYLAPPQHQYGYRTGARYYVLNALQELDRPGEWYVDRQERALYLWPPAPLEEAEVVLSMLAGPVIALRDASHIALVGLTIEAGRGSGIEIFGGNGNTVSDCVVRDLRGDGIVVSGGWNHVVRRCEIAHVGGAAVSLSGGNRVALEPAGHAVLDSRIHDFARVKRTYAPGVKLEGVGQRAAGNLIYDAPHIGVWFLGNEHRIERNEIHDVCRETSDAGAIYTGRDWTERGTVIRYNYIHDVLGVGAQGAQAIYLDDAASGIVVTGNVLRRTHTAVLAGGGRDNVIEGNLTVECDRSIVFDDRGLNWMKAAVTPPKGVLARRLAEMPVDRAPWSERYPGLSHLLSDEPGSPKYNVVRDNVAYHCKPAELVEAVARFGSVGNNESWDTDPLEKSGSRRHALSFDARFVQRFPMFGSIPLGLIGPGSR